MSTVAVTGAGGFLGRRLVARLEARGLQVRSLVREAPGRLDVWSPGRAAPSLFEGVDAVCHVAAHVPADQRDPGQARTCLEVNALGTLQLLETARDAGVGAFVYASAANAYAPTDEPAREGDAVWPVRLAPWYLSSKMLGDLYVEHAHRAGWLRGVCIRAASIYGPGCARGVVRTFASRLAEGSPVRVADGGRYEVDLVHVDDVAEAMVRSVERQVFGPINVGSGRAVTLLEIARTLAAAFGVPDDRVQVEPADGEAPGGFSPVDVGRAATLLDLRPMSPEVGLAAYARSFRP